MSNLTRSQIVLDEYAQAPPMMLVFPRSGQTWQLRLTPHFARGLADEIAPMARFHRASRRWRRRSTMVRRSWQRAVAASRT